MLVPVVIKIISTLILPTSPALLSSQPSLSQGLLPGLLPLVELVEVAGDRLDLGCDLGLLLGLDLGLQPRDFPLKLLDHFTLRVALLKSLLEEL